MLKTLLLYGLIEIGMINGGVYNYSDLNVVHTTNPFYVKANALIYYKSFFIGGQMDCYFTPIDILNYSPFQMTYIFNTGFDFDTVKLGYEHSCFHPMQPYATIIDYEIKPKYEGGYNKFYIQFKL